MIRNTTQKILNDKLVELELITQGDVISFTGSISQSIKRDFKLIIEDIKNEKKRNKITVILSTNGGTAEGADDMVNILRNNYKIVDFIIPDYAMSAGTILAMSGDDIYMDYSSALGPIDPQIPDNNKGSYIPASGYLDRINELIEKEKNGETLTVSELNIVVTADIGRLKFIEQAKNLTVTLLKEWLVKYKFKDWNIHEGKYNLSKKGKKVTISEKKERAEEIATLLGDVNTWHTHGRTIDISKLRTILKLKIKEFKEIEGLELTIKEYYDILNMLAPDKNKFYIHTRNYI